MKRTVAAPGHVQVVMPTGRAVSGLDGDDEDGQKKKKPAEAGGCGGRVSASVWPRLNRKARPTEFLASGAAQAHFTTCPPDQTLVSGCLGVAAHWTATPVDSRHIQPTLGSSTALHKCTTIFCHWRPPWGGQRPFGRRGPGLPACRPGGGGWRR